MKTLIVSCVVVALAVCVAAGWCQGRPGPGGPPPGGPPRGGGMIVPPPPPAAAIDGITEALALTEEQAAELKVLLTNAETTLQPLMKTAGDAGKAVRDAMAAGDIEAAANLVDAAADAQYAVTKACLEAWGQIKAGGALTDEQFQKLTAGPGPAGPPPGDRGEGGRQSGARNR